ncbi:MAG: sugar phosphate isomerase/epimerase [Planctomycetota bacterium]|jgi:sugar phosphate isomerase/epimerase|nr:sugar phosphate isomerase/epimerase [Planctomycetota bacterium]
MFRSLSPGAVGINVPFEEALNLAAEYGFDALDLNVGNAADIADEHGIDAVRKMYDDAGVSIGGWGLPVQFRTTDEEFEQSLEGFDRLARTAGQLGARWCSTWVMPCSDDVPFSQNFENHTRRLRTAAEVLRSHGCSLGLEFVGPWTMRREKKYPFIFDMPSMLKLCESINTGNVGLLLDCWHWYTSWGSVQDILRLRGSDVVYVHINDAPKGIPEDEQVDNVRTLPGATGVIDISGFLAALNAIGFNGPVAIEPFDDELRATSKENPAEGARITAEAMNKVWSEAGLE